MSEIPLELVSHILNERLRVDDEVLIKSYALSIELNDDISNQNKQLLWMFILYSKDADHDREVEIGAANAITILNYARVSFAGIDLTNVRIRGANLSNAILDHTDLSGANLTGVDLRGAFLGGAILKLPDMTGVNLGESVVKLPFSVDYMCIVPNTDLIIIRKTAGWVYIAVYNFVNNTILTQIDNAGGGSGMVLSPNNKWLAFGSKNNSLQIHDISDPRNLKLVRTLDFGIKSRNSLCLAFSVSGLLIASGNRDGTMNIWDLKDPENRVSQNIDAHSKSVTSLSFSINETLASGSEDSTVKIWSQHMGSYQNIAELEFTFQISCLIFSNSGEKLAVSYYTNIEVYNTSNYHSQPIKLYGGHLDEILHMIFDHEDVRLVSAGKDGTIKLWNTKESVLITSLDAHVDEVSGVNFINDGKSLISASRDATLKFWELNEKTFKSPKPNPSFTSGNLMICFPNYEEIAVVSISDIFILDSRNLTTKRRIRSISGEVIVLGKAIARIAFSQNGQYLCASTWAGLFTDTVIHSGILIWDLSNDNPPITIELDTQTITEIAFNEDGSKLAVGFGPIVLYEFQHPTYTSRAITTNHVKRTNTICFSNNSQLIVSSSDDSISLHKIGQNDSIKLNGHTNNDNIVSVNIHKDNSNLISASQSGDIIFWDLSSDTPTMLWKKNTGCKITGITFSNHNNYFALTNVSGDLARNQEDIDREGIVYIWETSKFSLDYTIYGHQNDMSGLRFNEDSGLGTCGQDGTIMYWEHNNNKWLLRWATRHLLYFRNNEIQIKRHQISQKNLSILQQYKTQLTVIENS